MHWQCAFTQRTWAGIFFITQMLFAFLPLFPMPWGVVAGRSSRGVRRVPENARLLRYPHSSGFVRFPLDSRLIRAGSQFLCSAFALRRSTPKVRVPSFGSVASGHLQRASAKHGYRKACQLFFRAQVRRMSRSCYRHANRTEKRGGIRIDISFRLVKLLNNVMRW